MNGEALDEVNYEFSIIQLPLTGLVRRAGKQEQRALKNPRCLSGAAASFEDFSSQTLVFRARRAQP